MAAEHPAATVRAALGAAVRKHGRPVWPREVADELADREQGSAGAFLALRQLQREGKATYTFPDGWQPAVAPKPGPPQFPIGQVGHHA